LGEGLGVDLERIQKFRRQNLNNFTMAVTINFKDNRPEGYYTYTDKQLSKICKEVEQFLLQQNFFILTLLDARKIRGNAE